MAAKIAHIDLRPVCGGMVIGAYIGDQYIGQASTEKDGIVIRPPRQCFKDKDRCLNARQPANSTEE